jgi:hypothetical protein
MVRTKTQSHAADLARRCILPNRRQPQNCFIQRGQEEGNLDIHCILETWDIQGGGFSKIGIDWRKLPQAKGLASWFRTSHSKYWTSMVHNKNKDVPTTIRQQGGIAIFHREGTTKGTSRAASVISGTSGDGTHGYCNQIPIIG